MIREKTINDEVLLTKETAAQFYGNIVDELEDFCEYNSIMVPSEDRDLEIKSFREDNPDESAKMSDEDIIKENGFARIYGSAYDEIIRDIKAACSEILDNNEIVYFEEKQTKEIINKTLNNFESLIKSDAKALDTFKTHKSYLTEMIIELFFNWKVR